MLSRRGRIGLLLASVALVLAMVPAATKAPGSAAAGESARDTLIVGVTEVPQTLEPAIFSLPQLAILFNTQEPFFEYKYRRLPESPVPWFDPEGFQNNAIESYTIARDGRTIAMRVRPIKSPYGNTLTSEDMKWTILRNIALNTQGKFPLQNGNVDDNPVTIVSPRTFVLNISSVSPVWRQGFQLWAASPIDSQEAKKHATQDDPWAKDWLRTHTAGHGAYHVTDFTPGQEVTMVANPNYWGVKPAIKKITIRAIPNPGNLQLALATNTIQYVQNLPRLQLAALKRTGGDITVLFVPHTRVSYLGFNVTREPFNNRLVREAFAWAIPYEDLIRSAYDGTAQRAMSAIPSFFPCSRPEQWPYSYDPKKAKDLLAQAGYPNGLTVTLDYGLGNPGPENAQTAVLLQSAFREVGINLQLNQASSDSAFQQGLFGRRYNLFMSGISPAVPDGGYALRNMATNKGPSNNGGWDNEQFNKLVDTSWEVTNQQERCRVLGEAQQIFAKEVPFALLLYPNLGIAHRSNLTGYRHLPMGFPYFKYFSFK